MNLEELYEKGAPVISELQEVLSSWLLPEGGPLLDRIEQYRWGQTGFGTLTRSSPEKCAACARADGGTGVSWPQRTVLTLQAPAV